MSQEPSIIREIRVFDGSFIFDRPEVVKLRADGGCDPRKKAQLRKETMKREFLEGLGLNKETVDKIMAENGADIEREPSQTTQAKADLADAQQKLADRDKDLEALKATAGDVEASKKALEELQTKYSTETEQLKAQIADRDYSDAITRAISGKSLKFSSKAAERDFIASIKDKKLEFKDG